jgi:hypothetical protein
MAFVRLVEGGSGADPSKSYRPRLLSLLESTERKAQKQASVPRNMPIYPSVVIHAAPWPRHAFLLP